MKDKIEVIRKLGHDIGLLYVEDNFGLRHNMTKLLSKVFKNVITAEDGEDGYNKYLEYKPKIIINDILMPKMNGFNMIKKIKASDEGEKIIVLSAYDDKKYLHVAIELGVYRYLQKPVKINDLVKSLHDAVVQISEEENQNLFLKQIQNIFNYQNNIVVMMDAKGEFLLCNKRFEEFFGVENLSEFREKYPDIDKLLLEHKEFLFSTKHSHWYEKVVKNHGDLFHTKIKNKDGDVRHLILKSREVPEKEGYSVLSFDDVTELNLMSLFDSESAQNDLHEQNTKSILNLMRVIQNNSAEVKIHNFYKGLTIVNPAVIAKITDTAVTMKTANTQLKIVNLTKFMTISSEIFPKNVICRGIKDIDVDNQSITISDMNFGSQNITDRKYIRLEPDAKHTCTMFYKDIKIMGDSRIVDISEVSVKIEIFALPAGMSVGDKVKVSMSLDMNGRLIPITTDGEIYRIDENPKSYYVIVLYELMQQKRKDLTEYMAVRQMALIREFKRMNIM